MKYILLISVCVFLMSCSETPSSKHLTMFDVSHDYPVKSIALNDIANVHYIVPEVHSDFLFKAFQATTSKDYLIIKDVVNEKFLFFDKEGKIMSKVDRRGNGPEEYMGVNSFFYNEQEENLYLSCRGIGIRVYDRNGNYQRTIPTEKDLTINRMSEFDKQTLLAFSDDRTTPFFLIHKIDGSIKEEIDRIKEEDTSQHRLGVNDFKSDFGTIDAITFYMPSINLVKNKKEYILTNYSADTVYRYTQDRVLTPALVRRPSIEQTDPMIFLHSWVETNDFIFFSTQKKEYIRDQSELFPKTGYLVEKRSGDIFRQQIRNTDLGDKPVIIDPFNVSCHEESWSGVVSYTIKELHEAAKANKLKGKLKELYDNLGEEDEYIFMLISLH
ncbi:6-bladed beta-propeller [Parabacteroides sp. PF5-9]|uniref:6-bladed beta-propeller n=1 Tax=Parabacteroides sp. PF5-9 TaxID=1742404 RepID=UPI0024772960|nr:6-bladed beta-propeller [Parabacteroides sp. PF5-9]MDH6359008.1 hypothetical protein [Parabacteroides sp. PF5-9]